MGLCPKNISCDAVLDTSPIYLRSMNCQNCIILVYTIFEMNLYFIPSCLESLGYVFFHVWKWQFLTTQFGNWTWKKYKTFASNFTLRLNFKRLWEHKSNQKKKKEQSKQLSWHCERFYLENKLKSNQRRSVFYVNIFLSKV